MRVRRLRDVDLGAHVPCRRNAGDSARGRAGHDDPGGLLGDPGVGG
jgi:hypothetical protein